MMKRSNDSHLKTTTVIQRALQSASVVAMAMTLVLLPAANAQAGTAQFSDAIMFAQVDGAAAARSVERSTGGKVLSVSREERNGRAYYRVKVLLPEGRVRTVIVDAETGATGG